MWPNGPGCGTDSVDSLSSLGTRCVNCDPRGRARNCHMVTIRLAAGVPVSCLQGTPCTESCLRPGLLQVVMSLCKES